jgi:hypothetical protein
MSCSWFSSFRLSLAVFLFGSSLWALPGKIIQNESSIPVVALESLDLGSFTVLKKFDPFEHLPDINRKEHAGYFLHRNRTVYLAEDQQFAVKIWEEHYPSSLLFLSAVRRGFYREIAKIEGLIFDQNGNCRGYITPYMISRTFHKTKWESYGFVLEKNAFGVKIFASCDQQPPNYHDLFVRLVKSSRETGLISIDVCPNNVVIDPGTETMYLIDLEDVLDLKKISLENAETQMILEYNPKDYLNIFKLSL